ncbi:MAG: menaquinone biosynthesis protein [Dehalococcoidia bacterium]
MAIKAGRVSYLSCEPFYFSMAERGIELQDIAPSDMAAALENGVIDAGLVPLTDCLRIGDRFQTVAGFCLATIRKAGSVLLHSQQPIQELAGARIGIAAEAATASQLLRILLEMKYEVQPKAYVTLEDPHNAFLLIGDQALRRRGGLRDFPHKYDLGEEWNQWTSLPFVFARWVVRKDIAPQDSTILEDTLYSGLQDWADGLYHLSDSRNNLRMHPQDIIEYSQGLRYFIGVPEQRAIDRFQQYLDQLNANEGGSSG